MSRLTNGSTCRFVDMRHEFRARIATLATGLGRLLHSLAMHGSLATGCASD